MNMDFLPFPFFNLIIIMRKTYIYSLVCCWLFLWSLCMQAYAQRECQTFNEGWRFYWGDCETAFKVMFDDSEWESVHLPHTWNSDAYEHKDYLRGVGWYRKRFTIPEAWQGKRIFLKFDAASQVAAVYLDGKEVNSHVGGYTAFIIDLTAHLSDDGMHTVAVRVDNARTDVLPLSGDFTFFGGLYRDVWLIATAEQHFDGLDDGSDGIFVDASQNSSDYSVVSVRSKVRNASSKTSFVEVEHVLFSPEGDSLMSGRKAFRMRAGERISIEQKLPKVVRPTLWTPETPALYRLKTILRDKHSREVLDEREHYTAFRWFHFDGENGFFLNGKPYKLRGMCRHQDQFPFGTALTDEMHRRDFRWMKEMGCNFLRIAHYPQDDALLEMCDRQGMLVWEEIPVIDKVPDSEAYAASCEQSLREMIRQHYNHPSVILWGYMNEILLKTMREHGQSDQLAPILERTRRLAYNLEAVLHQEDSTRNSAVAFHGSDDYNKHGLGSISEVIGWNLYNGWYGGNLNGLNRFLEQQHQHYPERPLLVSEYGAGSDCRIHSLHPKPFDFSMEYQQIFLEHYLPFIEQTPYICGATHWNLIDFSSALREESMPRINNKGLLTNDRTPKDVYYYYQATWRKDIPVLHIATRDWLQRVGVQEQGETVMLPVKVYTNLPEVELLLDGRSLGKKPVANCHAVFDVPFQTEYPYLKARGMYQGEWVEDAVKLRFANIPAQLDSQNIQNLELAINVGSQCFYTSAATGLTWVSDRAYSPGGWGYVGGESHSSTKEIFQTSDGPLFQSARIGLSGYQFDVPVGTYEVELLFADTSIPSASLAYLLGHDETDRTSTGNTFSILMNGCVVDQVFFSHQVESCQAVRKRYLVKVSDYNGLRLGFKVVNGYSLLSGIKLRKL